MRQTSAELFLDEMERIVQWSAMESLVRSHYAKAGHGRPRVGLSIMRAYFVQQWLNLSDPNAGRNHHPALSPSAGRAQALPLSEPH